MEKYDKDGQNHEMKIRGPLVDMLVQIAPEVYKDFVSYERGKKNTLCTSPQSNLWHAPVRIIILQED